MSEDTDQSQKTEEPTPKKIEEARRRGQVAVSREVNTWMMLLVGTILLAMMAPELSGEIKGIILKFIERPHLIAFDRGNIGELMVQLMKDVAGVLALPMIIVFVIGLATGLVQNGFLLAPKALEPRFDKFNPVQGLRRMVSAQSWMEFAKGIGKVAIVGAVAVIPLLPLLGRLDTLPTFDVGMLPLELQGLVLKLLIGVLAVLAVITVIDFIFQRYQYMKQLRMTKQEVKEEYKQTEGDPSIKNRLRKVRSERAQRRMMQAVPEADVVVTNPTHYAVALKYEPEEMEAPKLVAKGQDLMAPRIREVAEEHGVVIVENPPLAQALYASVELDEEIPPEHYKAVAEVISYVWGVKGKLRPGGGQASAAAG